MVGQAWGDPGLWLAVGLLVLTGAGAGGWLRSTGDYRADALVGFAPTTLGGLLLLAALTTAMWVLGCGRELVLASAYSVAALGAWSGLRRGGALLGAGLPVNLLLLTLLSVPLLLAVTTPLLAHDAAAIWWPKIREVAAGEPPLLEFIDVDHKQVHYPRGLAWLACLASPWQAPDPRLTKLVPLVLTWLTAASFLAVARTRWQRGAALMAAVIFVVHPGVATWSFTGLADLAMGASIFMAGAGLTRRRLAGNGPACAVAGALGAASIKQEGLVVWLVVAAFFATDLLRGAAPRRRTALALLALLAVLPWWLYRRHGPPGMLHAAPVVLASPDLLAARLATVPRVIAEHLRDLPSLGAQRGSPPPWVSWSVLISLLLLLPRGPRPLCISPAVSVLLASCAVYTLSPSDLHWHVGGSLERVGLQAFPLLLLAASLRLVGSTGTADGIP